jgi:hypothetical protein
MTLPNQRTRTTRIANAFCHASGRWPFLININAIVVAAMMFLAPDAIAGTIEVGFLSSPDNGPYADGYIFTFPGGVGVQTDQGGIAGRFPGELYRAFFGFDISGLPADVHIVSAELKLFGGSIGSPGPAIVELVDFGDALDGSDFDVPILATAGSIPPIAVTNIYRSLDVTPVLLTALQNGWKLQFRVRATFEEDTGNQHSWSFAGSEPGCNGGPPPCRPVLVVNYAQHLVTALEPSRLWIGLKNSDDQGTRFDMRTEVYVNDALVSEGLIRCITGLTRNANKATEVTIPFDPIADSVPAASGDVVSLRVLARIGTNPDDTKCPGHNSAAGVRLYYDSASRPSRFVAEITPDPPTNLFLGSDNENDFLDGVAPVATTAKFKDSPGLSFSGGNFWGDIGTWSVTIP